MLHSRRIRIQTGVLLSVAEVVVLGYCSVMPAGISSVPWIII